MAAVLAVVAVAGVGRSVVERSSDGSEEAVVGQRDARLVPTVADDPCGDLPAVTGVAEQDGRESSCYC